MAFDLINTADWSTEDIVIHEKIECLGNIALWVQALRLPEVALPSSAQAFRTFRVYLREFLRSSDRPNLSILQAELDAMRPRTKVGEQPLTVLAIMPAFSIVSDPRELSRIKTCHRENCGWMFVDETKNSRRTWCLMETCGNRAKAGCPARWACRLAQM